MLLSKLISNEEAYVVGEDVEVKTLYSYSKKVVEKGLFFCLEGKISGCDFVDEAEKFGAVAVVTEKILNTPLTQVVVGDSRAAYSYYCAKFFGDPQKRLKIIGVVGTNGKTSTCKIIEEILNSVGLKIGNIGTGGVSFNGKRVSGDLTTPDPENLYRILDEIAEGGAEYAVMEVSAHAIKLKKVEPIKFDTLIFTNCTEDHLDYFKDMDVYRQVKKSIFLKGNAAKHIVNGDDPLGREIADAGVTDTFTYGIFNPADVFATMIKEGKNKTSFVLNLFDDLYDVTSPLLGRFNVYNLMSAITCAYLNGVEMEKVMKALKNMPVVEGRMEKVAKYCGGDVYVDYAHTPDGLENSLLYLRKVTKGNLVVVFGCGGNRDEKKRPLMGKTAGDIADFVIITSDNPRFEDAAKIITDVESGVREATMDYVSIKDRKTAIKYGLKFLKEGDSLLVAGKGAENYQEIMGVKHEFSDKKVVLEMVEDNV